MTIQEKIERKYGIYKEDLEKFLDNDKLEFLYKSIQDKRYYGEMDKEEFLLFIHYFYFDKQFNKLYFAWRNSGDKWLKPSCDHITSRKKGGLNSLDNLQYISWLENKLKSDLSQAEWTLLKKNLKKYMEF